MLLSLLFDTGAAKLRCGADRSATVDASRKLSTAPLFVIDNVPIVFAHAVRFIGAETVQKNIGQHLAQACNKPAQLRCLPVTV